VWVIGFVLVLSISLDRLLLRPVTRIMKARESAIGSARELAETSRARAQAAMDELDAKTRAARGDVYRQMEENRVRRWPPAPSLSLRHGARWSDRWGSHGGATSSPGRCRPQAARTRRRRAGHHIVERVLGRKASYVPPPDVLPVSTRL